MYIWGYILLYGWGWCHIVMILWIGGGSPHLFLFMIAKAVNF
jgi:hypothetical protein